MSVSLIGVISTPGTGLERDIVDRSRHAQHGPQFGIPEAMRRVDLRLTERPERVRFSLRDETDRSADRGLLIRRPTHTLGERRLDRPVPGIGIARRDTDEAEAFPVCPGRDPSVLAIDHRDLVARQGGVAVHRPDLVEKPANVRAFRRRQLHGITIRSLEPSGERRILR